MIFTAVSTWLVFSGLFFIWSTSTVNTARFDRFDWTMEVLAALFVGPVIGLVLLLINVPWVLGWVVGFLIGKVVAGFKAGQRSTK